MLLATGGYGQEHTHAHVILFSAARHERIKAPASPVALDFLGPNELIVAILPACLRVVEYAFSCVQPMPLLLPPPDAAWVRR